MKFILKVIVAVITMGVNSHAAHANLTLASTGSGSLFLYAFSQAYNTYYVRDLGYTLNTFLPSSVTTATGDGGVTGDKTPNSGLIINKDGSGQWWDSWGGRVVVGQTNFADSAFATWASNKTDVKWTIAAGDSISFSPTNVARALITTNASSASTALANQALSAAVNTMNTIATSNPLTLSTSGSGINANAASNFFLGSSTLGNLGDHLNVYYFVRTQYALANSTPIPEIQYANSWANATFSLAANGDLTYNSERPIPLDPNNPDSPFYHPPNQLPLPPAGWLLGFGLLSMFGFGKHRRHSSQATNIFLNRSVVNS